MVSEPIIDTAVVQSQHFISRLAADAEVGGAVLADQDRVLESIVEWVSLEFGSDHIIQAKEEFYWKTGKVFSDDDFFSSRMGYFLDYFVFQRLFGVKNPTLAGMTPFQAYHEIFGSEQNISLKDARHGVFEIHKIRDQDLTVVDLLTEEKRLISRRDHESFAGLHKKDVFQGFLYIGESKTLVSRGLLFHPKAAVGVIKKTIKRAKKNRDLEDLKLLSRLARQQLRQLRHRHVDPKTIYSEDPA